MNSRRGSQKRQQPARKHTSSSHAETGPETLLLVTEPTELMKFLLEKMPSKGRNKIKSLLAHRQVTIQGKPMTQFNHPLEVGQHVEIHAFGVAKEEQLHGVEILYEDADLLVIDKPAGLLSMASNEEKEKTAFHILMEHVQRIHPKNRVFIVHRLDRDTSGVMMFAKNEAVKKQLQETWRDSVLERIYIVLAEGQVRKPAGVIRSWLKETKTLKMYSSQTPNGGQEAITHYEVLRSNSNYSLLQVRLETGRKNQIRVHMEDIGHPIVGDVKYGSRQNLMGRLGLHASILSFLHPVTKQILRFESEIPASFLKAFR